MEEQKPKSIKTASTIIIVFSCFTLVVNIGSLLISIFIDSFYHDTKIGTESSLIPNNFIQTGFVMLIIGILYLITGFGMRLYKLWAKKLGIVISLLMILVIWSSMISKAITIGKDLGSFFYILNALIFSIPLFLLIKFLSKRTIKKHFV